MLVRLLVKNYALIETTEVFFAPGLNVLTGETGAGKSLLIGAIGLILGERAEGATLLHPDQKCIVEAQFTLPHPEILADIANAEELDLLQPELIIRREISPGGKSRAFINDTPVNLSTLRAVTGLLVDLHGQHDGQQLLSAAVQLRLLDEYANIQTLVSDFNVAFTTLKNVSARINELRAQESQARQQLDFFRFQLNELEKANLNLSEEENLEKELALLENAEQIVRVLTQSVDTLSESENNVLIQLKGIIRQIEKVGTYAENLAQQAEKLEEARLIIQDAAAELSGIAESTEMDPARLDEIQSRLDTYHRLKHKFGVRTTEELLLRQAELTKQVGMFSSLDEQIQELTDQAGRLTATVTEMGLRIEAIRKVTAQSLGSQINALLADVGLSKATFEIEVQRLFHSEGLLTIDNQKIQPNQRGLNSVVYKVRTNPGLPPAPLAQVASGGEISRIMLAIKAALAEKLNLSVLIFDEIDTGISGPVAMQVGRVMERLAQKHQLLTITHLPQIAGRGQHHFFIFKQTENGRTTSHIQKLSAEARALEIAKMIGGEQITENAIQSARELIGS